MKQFRSTNNAIILRMHGLRATPPRIAVLILFMNCKKPISAPDITKILSEIGFKIHLASIYRILKKFEKKGLVQKVGFKTSDDNEGRNKEIMYELK